MGWCTPTLIERSTNPLSSRPFCNQHSDWSTYRSTFRFGPWGRSLVDQSGDQHTDIRYRLQVINFSIAVWPKKIRIYWIIKSDVPFGTFKAQFECTENSFLTDTFALRLRQPIYVQRITNILWRTCYCFGIRSNQNLRFFMNNSVV